MGRNLDPGRKGCVLRLDRRLRRTPLARMGGDKLGIDAGRIDDGEAGILERAYNPVLRRCNQSSSGKEAKSRC
jgi:hypothetical protein